jgi:hypothetical protein
MMNAEKGDSTDEETQIPSKLWGMHGELWDPRGPLNDYSYAGCEEANPECTFWFLLRAMDMTSPHLIFS